MNEADTCRTLVVPKLQAAGWDREPARISEQVTFTDGRIFVVGQTARRRPGKRADFILRFRPDMPLAVVEAKPNGSPVGEGMQQAKQYAEILGLKFAYSTNGDEIAEFDYLTGKERILAAYPTPEVLWARLCKAGKISPQAAEGLLTPAYHLSGKSPRYYQEIAINRAVESVLQGKRRIATLLRCQRAQLNQRASNTVAAAKSGGIVGAVLIGAIEAGKYLFGK